MAIFLMLLYDYVESKREMECNENYVASFALPMSLFWHRDQRKSNVLLLSIKFPVTVFSSNGPAFEHFPPEKGTLSMENRCVVVWGLRQWRAFTKNR